MSFAVTMHVSSFKKWYHVLPDGQTVACIYNDTLRSLQRITDCRGVMITLERADFEEMKGAGNA